MDEFGVLVESIGFKGQRNSAPMADLKNKRHVAPPTNSVYNNIYGSNNSTQMNYSGFDDVFGDFKSNSKSSGINEFDFDSVFKGSNDFDVKNTMYKDDDIFDKRSASADDLFGVFDGFGLGSNGSMKKSEDVKSSHSGGFDDLMTGFGGKSPMKNRNNTGKIRPPPSAGDSFKSVSSPAGDPFIVLEQFSSQTYSSNNYSKPKAQDTSKKSSFSSIDELDVFAMGGQWKDSNEQSDLSQNDDSTNDLDSIFNTGSKSSNELRTKSTSVDPVYDSLFENKTSSMEKKGPTMGKTPFTSTCTKKATPRTNSVDDFLVFGEATPSSDVFQEIEGESEERRRARLNQRMRIQERMEKALAEKNQRDFRTQQEQEEKHRVAETMNDSIKRWAAGKEGNLRALLSSLQHVLWPECGWQTVSLTDLITSISVKKVYFKATLCVHPDKVQQKGATVQQKYIAEKVFDLLKEAWNKFNAEELK